MNRNNFPKCLWKKKDLRPHIFSADPRSSAARKQWAHWCKSFTCYIGKYENITDEEKLSLLINHVDAVVYEVIADTASSYVEAIVQLQRIIRHCSQSNFCEIFVAFM